MEIYLVQDGEQTGPFSETEIRAMLRAGSIELSDLAWHEDMTDWAPLQQVLQLPPAALPAAPPQLPARTAPTVPSPAVSSSPAPLPAATSFGGAMFLYIPVSRLVILSILSLGLYEIYWVYRNWRYFKERDGLNIWPFWRGFFGILWIYPLLKAIRNDAVANQIRPADFGPGGLAAGWISLLTIGNILSRVPDTTANVIGYFIDLPSFFFLLPVQKYINSINEALPQRPSYYRWSSGHFVCLGIGLTIILILGLAGLLEYLGLVVDE